jgi:L-threonylcarbamoyladenylate synthase
MLRRIALSMSNNAELLATHTPELFRAALAAAAEQLKSGEVVALPTETVYGLAANALDPVAVEKIYEIKGRPAKNPVIVHVASLEMARECVTHWPNAAEQLALSFWPGPLTLVLPRSGTIPDVVTAGGPTVGIRWPSHPFMQGVIRACGFPLAAPSANLSNEISPTSASHVLQKLGHKLRLIVDGGQSQVGIESTVVDLSQMPARVLRPGIIHAESLLAVLGAGNLLSSMEAKEPAAVLRSPGLLRKHYAPRARMIVLAWSNESDLLRQLHERSLPVEKSHIIAYSQIPSDIAFSRVCVIPHDPEAYARALYAELHRCDEEGAELIIVENVPDAPAWRAIADRLERASAS